MFGLCCLCFGFAVLVFLVFLVFAVVWVFFGLWFDVFGFVHCLLMFVVRCWWFVVWCLVVVPVVLFGFGYAFAFWFWLRVLFVACVVCVWFRCLVFESVLCVGVWFWVFGGCGIWLLNCCVSLVVFGF